MDPINGGIEFAGSATSAFQAHPIFVNDAARRFVPASDWDLEIQKNLQGFQSHIKGGLRSNGTPKFFEKYPAYLKRSAELGENMFRFSFEMARLCPRPGEFNEAHMAENVRVLACMQVHGLERMVSINHFTLPIFLARIDHDGSVTVGGWEHPDAVKHFRFYLERVAEFLGNPDKMRNALAPLSLPPGAIDRFLAEGLVRYVMSINEPWTVIGNGYVFGSFPPFRKGKIFFGKILEKMVQVHDLTRDILKGFDQRIRVGVGYNGNLLDGWCGPILHRLFDRKITDAFERGGTHSDFLALQYYFRMTIPRFAGKRGRDYGDHPNFGDIYPQGIYQALKEMHEVYGPKDIFVTEFGFADRKDRRKPYWLLQTVRGILEAKRHGVPVKGLLLWSLVNNLEWEQGMRCKFGLFDEQELEEHLPEDDGWSNGRLRSWEAWMVAIRAARFPTEENFRAFGECYGRAKIQYNMMKR